MSKQEREQRAITEAPSATLESRSVEGYAALFNSPSVLMFGGDGEFVETIAAGAFDGVVEVSDVKCLLNHDERRGLLARSRSGEGSLTLTVDDKGLKYAFDAPATALGDELLEGLRRGDISGSSFAFTVSDDEWKKQEDGTYFRTIKKIDRLFDVSPVYDPAYPETSVDLRGLDELRSGESQTAAEDQEPAEAKGKGNCTPETSRRVEAAKALYL